MALTGKDTQNTRSKGKPHEPTHDTIPSDTSDDEQDILDQFGQGEDGWNDIGEGEGFYYGEGEEGDGFDGGLGFLGSLLNFSGEGEHGEGEGDAQSMFANFFLEQVRQKTKEMELEEALEADDKSKSSSMVPKPFKGKDYYEILGIDNDANEQEIIKAYRKLALQYHPDRNHGDKEADRTFAYLSRVHKTLIDPRKRQMYDKHGESSIEMTDTFIDAYEHWKSTFGDLTPTDTELYRVNYEDTEEEYQDVIKAFNESEGDLFLMMKNLLFFSSVDTFERDRDMVLKLIKEGCITNKKYINNFHKGLPTVKQRLIEDKEQEDKQYEEFRQEAIRRVKRRKGNKYTDDDVEKELVQLITRHNSSSDDLLDSVALQFAKKDIERLQKNPKTKTKGKKRGRN